MHQRPDIIYQYDGSYHGLLCCVFQSYLCKEIPLDIFAQHQGQTGLYDVKTIETVPAQAQRVQRSIEIKLGRSTKQLLETAFLNSAEDKAQQLFTFIRLGYQLGPQVYAMYGHTVVSAVHKLAKAVEMERHHMLGFLRFAQYKQGLIATYESKHFVLPLMAEHFCDRLHSEQFLIYDKTHGAALVYGDGKAQLLEVNALHLPPALEQEEAFYQALWRGYYQAATVEGRENPKCRQSFMPKRFWAHLPELQPQPPTAAPQLPSQNTVVLPPAAQKLITNSIK